MSIEEPKTESNEEEIEKEETFREYMEKLDLSPEDFEKKILDIGADSANFAKWAKEHGVSSSIYSLEPSEEIKNTDKGVRGISESLPFTDGSFDLVVSNCAIPHIFSGEEDEKRLEKQITKSISESIRVLREGGEVRLGSVLVGEKYENQRKFKDALNGVLGELEKEGGLEIQKTKKGRDTYESDESGHPTDELLAESFLIKIKKLK